MKRVKDLLIKRDKISIIECILGIILGIELVISVCKYNEIGNAMSNIIILLDWITLGVLVTALIIDMIMHKIA